MDDRGRYGLASYEEIPRWIMAGYTRILDEAATEWGATPPDVVIAQVGVGSLAGALAGWLVATFAERRPLLVTVEPSGSACLLESLRAGRLTPLASCAPTEMVGLRCAEVSPVAWSALEGVVDAAIAIGDGLATEAQDRLAPGRRGRCRSGGPVGRGRRCRTHGPHAGDRPGRASTEVEPVARDPRAGNRDRRPDAAARWSSRRYSFRRAVRIGSTPARAARGNEGKPAVPTARISSTTATRATPSSGVIPKISDSTRPLSA